jgi:hypothetical protein
MVIPLLFNCSFDVQRLKYNFPEVIFNDSIMILHSEFKV